MNDLDKINTCLEGLYALDKKINRFIKRIIASHAPET